MSTYTFSPTHPAPGQGEGVLGPQLADPWFAERLFDCMPDVVFYVKDRQGQYVVVNETLVRRRGLTSKQQILGRTVLDIAPTNLAASSLQQDLLVLETGAEIHGRLEWEAYADGSLGWCEIYKFPLRDAAGRIVGLAGFCRDLHRSEEEQAWCRQLAGAVRHLQEHFAERLRIEDLARLSDMSVRRFNCLVKRIFGVTPRQLLVRTRLDAASRLLLLGTATIAEVAYACGYADHSAFTRQFRAAVGVAPTQFREAARQRWTPVEGRRWPSLIESAAQSGVFGTGGGGRAIHGRDRTVPFT